MGLGYASFGTIGAWGVLCGDVWELCDVSVGLVGVLSVPSSVLVLVGV
jgi:hypothetical protein